MTEKAIEIIKGAMLLEHNGKAFYENVARSTRSAAVRDLFQSMAMEEAEHLDILGKQYASLKKDGRVYDIHLPEQTSDFSPAVLTDKVKAEIGGAGYEAAAISAAMMMEQKAVEYYGDRARTAEDPAEQKLFKWLTAWEQTHLDLLVSISEELKEKVWYDQSFWPM